MKFWAIIYIIFGLAITYAFFSPYGGGFDNIVLKLIALPLIYLLLYVTYWLIEYEETDDKEKLDNK